MTTVSKNIKEYYLQKNIMKLNDSSMDKLKLWFENNKDCEIDNITLEVLQLLKEQRKLKKNLKV